MNILKNTPFFLVACAAVLSGCATTNIEIKSGISLNDAQYRLEYYYTSTPGLNCAFKTETVSPLDSKNQSLYWSCENAFEKRRYFHFEEGILVGEIGKDEYVAAKNKIVTENSQMEAENLKKEIARQEEERKFLMQTEQKREGDLRRRVEATNALIAKMSLSVKYRDKGFAVAQAKNGKIVYILDGEVKTKDEVSYQIREYELNLQIERQAAEKRAKNLSQKWMVSAQGRGYCSVLSVTANGRDEDGSAMFSISYRCSMRRGSGSVGSTTLSCGVNRQNYLSSTNIEAKCY